MVSLLCLNLHFIRHGHTRLEIYKTISCSCHALPAAVAGFHIKHYSCNITSLYNSFHLFI